MLKRVPTIQIYLVFSLAAGLLLGIGFPVSEARSDISKADHSIAIHELDRIAGAEHDFAKIRREESSDSEISETTHLAGSPVLAKSDTTEISGRLVTTKGRAISHVELTLNEEDGTSTSTVANSFGYFRFSEIRTDQRIAIKTVGIIGYACTSLNIYVTGVSSANFSCPSIEISKAAKKDDFPPAYLNHEIIARPHPDDSASPAEVPTAEHRDYRNSGSR